MSRTRVKICGITRQQDALAAINAGADAIGLVFYPPSPRAITADQIPEILPSSPGFVTVVGLFVDPSTAEVEAALSCGVIDCLQFHGSEPAEFCASFGKPFIKALRVRQEAELRQQAQDYHQARLILLDSYSPHQAGGTGTTFDWDIAAAVEPLIRRRLVLAGGLSADNVAAAISALKPYAVDVSSGVERAPGIKDEQRLMNFFKQVQEVDSV